MPKAGAHLVAFLLLVAACKPRQPEKATPDAAPTPTSGPPTATPSTAERASDGCVHVETGPRQPITTIVDGTIRMEARTLPREGGVLADNFVVLDKPVCVVGSAEVKETKEIQLTFDLGVSSLPELAGKRVRLMGAAFLWPPKDSLNYVRPIIMNVTSVTEL